MEQARQHLNALAAQIAQTYPTYYPAASKWSLRIEPVEQNLTGGVRPTLVVLLAAVGFVLLMVAVNMASLLVARSSARLRELAIRQALGASRARIIRQLLTESILVSLAGGLSAMLVLWLTKGSLLALMPADLPRLTEVHFDARVVALACALSLVTGILFGLTPALHASRTDPNTDLKEGARNGSPSLRQNRFRGALVASEIALCVVLLSGAGLLVHSFWNTLQVNPGFDAERLLVARIWVPFPNNPNANKYLKAPAMAALNHEILRQVRLLPGIEEAAMGGNNSVPLVNNGIRQIAFSLPDQPDSADKQRSAEFSSVSPEFFHVLRTPLLRGRFFSEADTDKTKRVVMVNESFAKQYLPGGDVGHRINFFGADREISGVVADIRDDGLDSPVAPRVYSPLYQGQANEIAIFLRGAADSSGLKQAVTRVVHGIDPDLPVYGVRTMREMMGNSLARRRFSLSLMAVFGALALFLASIGIYGVMAYAVSQRAQEFSIRMALGADARDILLLTLRPGAVLTLIGVALGLVAAQGATHLMSSLLFGVSPGRSHHRCRRALGARPGGFARMLDSGTPRSPSAAGGCATIVKTKKAPTPSRSRLGMKDPSTVPTCFFPGLMGPWKCSLLTQALASSTAKSLLCKLRNQRDERTHLPKEDNIEVMGKVVEKFKAGMFSVELDAGKTVLAAMAGRLRRNRIKIMNGDRVTLELSPYDLTRGRITYRHK